MDVEQSSPGNVDGVHSGAGHQRASSVLCQTLKLLGLGRMASEHVGTTNKPELVSAFALLGQDISLVIPF